MDTADIPVETTVINNARLFTGEGSSPIERGHMVIAGEDIVSIGEQPLTVSNSRSVDPTVVDAAGKTVLPGLIDSHVHSVTEAPFGSACAASPKPQVAKRNRDRHLRQGATTVISVDPFAFPEDVRRARNNHPLKIELGACPCPSLVEAARLVDGEGLTQRRRNYTIPEAIEAGAVMMGELGGGSTLAGSVQRILFVPRAIKERTGSEIEAAEADALITAVLGRHADPGEYDEESAQEALYEAGLAEDLTPNELRELIMDVTWPSVEHALNAVEEVAEYSTYYDIPFMIHNAAASKSAIEKVANEPIHVVAGHSNHPTFTYDEALEFAQQLRRHETVTIDISSWDLFTDSDRLPPAKKEEMREQFVEFVDRGLVDTITTDWSWKHPGGDWHSLLVPIKEIVDRGVLSLEQAITLVTRNPAETFPHIGTTRGTLAPGKAADFLIVSSEDITSIESVFVDGRPVLIDDDLAY